MGGSFGFGAGNGAFATITGIGTGTGTGAGVGVLEGEQAEMNAATANPWAKLFVWDFIDAKLRIGGTTEGRTSK